MFRFVLTSLVGMLFLANSVFANILPATSPEEQYQFALELALQDDLANAEQAFEEFTRVNKGHSRESDSIFWLGRVQFMGGKFKKAAITLSGFNSAYPNDVRVVMTSIMIADAVSRFALPRQACEIYSSLSKFLGDATSSEFIELLLELRDAANCDGDHSVEKPPMTASSRFTDANDTTICSIALFHDGELRQDSNPYVQEAKRRGLKCAQLLKYETTIWLVALGKKMKLLREARQKDSDSELRVFLNLLCKELPIYREGDERPYKCYGNTLIFPEYLEGEFPGKSQGQFEYEYKIFDPYAFHAKGADPENFGISTIEIVL